MKTNYTKISKFLCLVLRHKPQEIGISLDRQGRVRVDILLAAMKQAGRALSLGDLEEIVRSDEKGRYTLENGYIRANQGHSVPIDLDYTMEEPQEFLFHGTARRNFKSISEDGINKGKRHHVHLSDNLETATAVGKRHGEVGVLVIRANDMHRDGYEFYRSANGVWLTDHVPPQYILYPPQEEAA